jgi:chromosomal replication initiation ATPase DnaA
MTPTHLLESISRVHNVPVDLINSRCRITRVAEARFMLCGLLTQNGVATAKIAAFLNRDRTTICHAVIRHMELMATCRHYREKAGRAEF